MKCEARLRNSLRPLRCPFCLRVASAAERCTCGTSIRDGNNTNYLLDFNCISSTNGRTSHKLEPARGLCERKEVQNNVMLTGRTACIDWIPVPSSHSIAKACCELVARATVLMIQQKGGMYRSLTGGSCTFTDTEHVMT